MRPYLPAIAFVLLLGLAVAWFLASHERAPRTEPIRPSAEAWVDHFLVARRLLDGFAIAQRNLDTIEAELPEGAAVIVLPAGRGVVSPGALQRLQDSVAAGAHLIVESEEAELDPVLDAFGIVRVGADDDNYSREWWRSRWMLRTQSGVLDASELLTIERKESPPLRVTLHGPHTLESLYPTLWEARRGDDVRALQLAHGEGRVTVVDDLGFAYNFVIGRNDNAEFLLWLVADPRPPAEVVFVAQRNTGLWPWLRDNAWTALIGLGLLLAVWLWSLAPRFGPLLPDPEPARRRLLDHLRASGRLLWAGRAGSELAAQGQAYALDAWERHYPHVRLLQPAARIAQLQLAGLSLEQAQSLLGPAATDGPALAAQMRAARALHAHLALARGRLADPLYHSHEMDP